MLSGSLNLSQLRAWYAVSDAYVSHYRAEGFNLPVLEAMGCGTHVIVSGGGATDDFLPAALGSTLHTRPGTSADQPQVQGQFVMPDLDDLIAAMQEVVDHGATDSMAREEARSTLSERYSWGAVTLILLDLL